MQVQTQVRMNLRYFGNIYTFVAVLRDHYFIFITRVQNYFLSHTCHPIFTCLTHYSIISSAYRTLCVKLRFKLFFFFAPFRVLVKNTTFFLLLFTIYLVFTNSRISSCMMYYGTWRHTLIVIIIVVL